MSATVRSAAVRLTMENSSYIRGANQAASATEVATGRMKRSVRGAAVSTGRDWDAMGKYGGRYALAVGAGLAAVVKTTSDFTSEMALVRTLSHANASEMDQLSKAALTVGQNIGYSAKEVAAGEEEMIKAGVSVKDILGGGLKGALDLAAAGQTDVATATSIAASALTQFRLKGKDVPHVADLLAAGADKALGSVEDLGYGLEQSGTTAHQMGLSIEQTTGTLAAFAQAGLTGERGGTTFKQMLLQLAAPTSQAQKLMDKYGVSLYNANGQIKTMPQLAGNLRQAFSRLDPASRNAALGVIFGSRAIQGANILMADGRSEIAKWIHKVDDQGFAAGQASGKLDSLSGDYKKLKATLATTLIGAGSPSQHVFRSMVQDADHLLKDFSQLPDEVQQGVVKVLALTAGVGATLYTIAKVRKIAGELGGFGRGKAGGSALGRAASIAAPVPVFVTNMGAGGLGGAAGKGGGGTVLGGGAAAAEGKLFGKIPLKYLNRGSVAVGLASLVLEGLGVGSKTHAGSTLSLAGAGSFGGPVGTIGGAIIGGGIDIYHSGNSNKNALNRALDALDSGTMKEKKAALADLNKEIDKLQNGGSGQNFNRFVTAVSGRGPELLEVRDALAGVVDVDKKAQLKNLRFLLDPNYKGKRPNAAAVVTDAAKGIDALLDPGRKGGKRRVKEKTSEDVLAEFYGINTRKLKPVDLLSDITGIADVFGKPGKGGGKRAKNPVTQLSASLGLDTSGFDKKAGRARKTAATLDGLSITPSVMLKGADAASAALARIRAEMATLPRRLQTDYYVVQHNALSKGVAHGGKDGDPSTPYAGGGYTGRGDKYEPAGIVHRREFVFSAEATDGNEAYLDAMHRRLRGYAAGGLVGAPTQAYAAGAGITVIFPTPAVLAAAVAAADAIAGSAAKVERTSKDVRQQNLDDLHTQQQIAGLQHDLHARNKKGKLELRGLDRRAAQAELADAKASLGEIRRQKEADLEEARKAEIEAQQQKRQDATDALTSAGDVFSRGTSPGSAIASVNRAVADISTYGQVMASLRAANASPALLQQLINRANQGDFTSAIRLGRALLAQPATLGQLNASLATLGSVSSSVANMTTDPRFLGSGGWAPTSTSVVQVNLTADPSSWLLEVKRIVSFEVERQVTGAIR